MDGADQDRAALDLLIRGFQVSRLIRLSADLAIADRIEPDGQETVAELAAACSVRAEPLFRALRALAAFGIFRVTADQVVAHTPRSLLLRTDRPNSLHHAARFWTAPGAWKAWNALDAALTGDTPHRAAWGVGRFEYLRDHPEEARIFDAHMANTPDDRLGAFAAAYDYSGASLIADIGGGNGQALRKILARFEDLRGLVFDRQDVVDAIPLEDRLNGRIAVQAGSFFDTAPAGADIYLLNWILHDWYDEDCLRILAACRTAMPPSARLLIGEHILDPDPALGRPMGYLLDAHMMAMFGSARERTEAEFAALLAASGFTLARVVSTASPFSIIEAVPQ